MPSIHANNLRRAVERYCLVACRDGPVRIDMPKGICVPIFRFQKAEAARMIAAEMTANSYKET